MTSPELCLNCGKTKEEHSEDKLYCEIYVNRMGGRDNVFTPSPKGKLVFIKNDIVSLTELAKKIDNDDTGKSKKYLPADTPTPQPQDDLNEEELKEKYGEPEDFDMGNKEQMEVYSYGYNKGFQKGKLEEREIGLFVSNCSNIDIRVFETEAISEDEDKAIELGVIKRECGLRVYPTHNWICIE